MVILNNQADLLKYFNSCVENHLPVALFITLPGCPKAELIINQRENFETKLEYYAKTYNDKLEHRFAEGVKIIGYTVIHERW